MNTVRHIAKNTGTIIFGDIINKIIALFVVIYLARYLGGVGFGKYSFVFAYLMFFSILTDLGISTILVREISRDKTKKDILVGNTIIMKAVLSVFAFFLSIVIITLMDYPLITKELVYIYSITLLFAAASPLGAMFQVNLEMKYPTVISIVTRIVSAILILWVIFTNRGLVALFILLVLSAFLSVLMTVYYSKQFVRPRFEIDFGIWKFFIRESWPLALTGVFVIIYYRIDQVMLSMMIGDAAVGYYAAAVNLAEPLGIIPAAFMMSMFPLMSKYYRTSVDSLKRSYELSFKYMLILVLPIAIGITLLSYRITPLIYGNEFLPSVSALAILIWAEVFIFINLVLHHIIISTNTQKIVPFNTAIMVVLNVLLNLLLIPQYSFEGAAIATVVTEGVGTILGIYFISKMAGLRLQLTHKTFRLVSTNVLFIAFLLFIRSNSLFLVIPISVIFYFFTTFLFKIISAEDIALLKKLILVKIKEE